jgi:hypothetical protein
VNISGGRCLRAAGAGLLQGSEAYRDGFRPSDAGERPCTMVSGAVAVEPAAGAGGVIAGVGDGLPFSQANPAGGHVR